MKLSWWEKLIGRKLSWCDRLTGMNVHFYRDGKLLSKKITKASVCEDVAALMIEIEGEGAPIQLSILDAQELLFERKKTQITIERKKT